MYKYSFIIPVYKHSPNFFVKLAEQYIDIEFIIIFTYRIINIKKLDNIKIIYERGMGFAKAINRGVEISSGEYIIVSNDDVYFNNTILQYIKNTDIQIPIIKNENGNIESIGSYLNTFAFNIHNKIIKKDKILFTGTFFIIKKSIFNQLGGFDKRFFMYYEDTDLALRAIKNNYKIIINDKLNIIHKGSFSKLKYKRYLLKRNRLYLILKHNFYKRYYKFLIFIFIELCLTFYQLLRLDFDMLNAYIEAYKMYKDWIKDENSY